MASAISSAAPLPTAARAEVVSLLDRLAQSGCRFNHNGSWHDAQAAREHLLTKLDYLERKASLQSAEQFIEKAATSSSMSGRVYQVQCGNTPAISSASWLGAQLKQVRAASAPLH